RGQGCRSLQLVNIRYLIRLYDSGLKPPCILRGRSLPRRFGRRLRSWFQVGWLKLEVGERNFRRLESAGGPIFILGYSCSWRLAEMVRLASARNVVGPRDRRFAVAGGWPLRSPLAKRESGDLQRTSRHPRRRAWLGPQSCGRLELIAWRLLGPGRPRLTRQTGAQRELWPRKRTRDTQARCPFRPHLPFLSQLDAGRGTLGS